MTFEPARTTTESKLRGQAVAGALAGVVVIIVLFAVFFVVQSKDHHDKRVAESRAAAAAAQAANQPADQPTADPQATADPQQPAAPPADVKIPPALAKQPVVKAGGPGKVTKLKVTPLVQGTGAVIKKGQTITANYVLVDYKTGQTLDSSWTGGQPFSTAIGVGQVIKGWDDAIPGQKVGSRLQIDVPEALAYPGKGDLRFVVDLLAAQ